LKNGWKSVTLDSICSIARGGSPRPIKDYITEDEEGVNWIKIGDATASSKYIVKTKQRIRKEGISKSRFVKEGDFLLSNSMSFGRPYIMKTTGCIHDGWLVLSDKTGEFDQDYLYHFLGSHIAYRQFDILAAGSTVRNLNIDLVSRVKVLLPPLPTQKRIVAILDEAFEAIDKTIANTEKNLQNARELFESYLNKVFTERGEGWEEKFVSEVCDIKHGFAFKSVNFDSTGKYVVLTPGSFYEKGGFRDQGVKTKYYTKQPPPEYILQKGDFLIAMTEQAVGLLGSSLIVPKANKYLHNQRLGLVQPKAGIPWTNDFFFHQMNTNRFRAAVQRTASGVKVRHTSPKKLGAIKVYYPPSTEMQSLVANQLNTLLAETDAFRSNFFKKYGQLNSLKQSILQKAFTGELTEDFIEDQGVL